MSPWASVIVLVSGCIRLHPVLLRHVRRRSETLHAEGDWPRRRRVGEEVLFLFWAEKAAAWFHRWDRRLTEVQSQLIGEEDPQGSRKHSFSHPLIIHILKSVIFRYQASGGKRCRGVDRGFLSSPRRSSEENGVLRRRGWWASLSGAHTLRRDANCFEECFGSCAAFI